VDATPYGKWDADVGRYAFYQVGEGFSSFVTGGDVEVNQFVGSLFAIRTTEFYGVARLTEIHEVCSLYGLPVFDIQAGYDSFC
jgi:hypothetical protein